MTSRPAIPADIQREIFIEAGHRCAVCGTPFPLERAHIVPWCQSHDHSAKNLICLCANCHERADLEWDEKTLREYKDRPWVSRQNSESTPSLITFTSVEIEIDLALPQFNREQRRWLKYALASFLNIGPESVRIKAAREGSTKVTVELPSESAARLAEAVSQRDTDFLDQIHPLSITNVRIPERRTVSFTLVRLGHWIRTRLRNLMRKPSDQGRGSRSSHAGGGLKQKPYVFISYVRENEDAVRRLSEELRAAGVAVWRDRHSIHPGQRWKQSTRKAIRDGAFFVACFSEEAVMIQHSYMNSELVVAIEELRRRPDREWFMPILLSKCELPNLKIGENETLRDIELYDLSETWESGVRRLIRVMQQSTVKLLAD